jgi:hypothetical protein
MAIVCCCCPFTRNEKDKASQAIASLCISNFVTLCPDDVSVFKKYMTLRNKAIAHSEFEYHPVRFDPETGGITRTRFTLFRHELKLDELETLVEKLVAECEQKRAEYALSGDRRFKRE